MLKQFFKDVMEMQPSFRSFLGERSFNKEYENIASEEYKKKWRTLIKKYKVLVERPCNTIDIDTLTIKWIVKNGDELLGFPDEWMCITSIENPILGFVVEDTNIYPLKTQRDVSDLISRTRKRIPFINDVMREMMDGKRNDRTIPKMICRKLIKQLEHFMAMHLYYVHIPSQLDSTEYTRVIDTEYVPVLHGFIGFLKGYITSCRNSIGICHVRNGKEMYKAIVRSSTTLDITPEEVHELGIKDIKRLYKELDTFRKGLAIAIGMKDHNTSNKQLFHAMRSRQSEYFDKSSEVLRAYKDAQESIRKKIIPKYFGYSVSRYKVLPVPKLLQNSSPGAYYQPPSMGKKRQGAVFINTISLKRNPRYTVDVLSLHEGIPGHHYQYQYMKQHKMPLYRMYAGDNDAYTEGWALYCEGFIETSDPRMLFGKWLYSMLRSVRLVVDTGIHYYGWSYKRALGYMRKHVPLEDDEIVVELERYICDPGQATSYRIGEQFFLEERDAYIGGGHGTIKDFHREVLECGPMPLDVLRHKLAHRMGCRI